MKGVTMYDSNLRGGSDNVEGNGGCTVMPK